MLLELQALFIQSAFFECIDLLSVKDKSKYKYDIILSSNTLEHFSNPFFVAEKLTCYANNLLVFLLPYDEKNLNKEHFFRFEYNNIPLLLKSFSLICYDILDCMEIDRVTGWYGKQILLVYKNADGNKVQQLTLELLSIFAERLDLRNTILVEKNASLVEKNASLDKQNLQLNLELNKLYNSTWWRLHTVCRTIAAKLVPVGSLRRKISSVFYRIGLRIAKFFLKALKKIIYDKSVEIIDDGCKLNFGFKERKVIYLFPVIDFSFRIQRPQQLCREFVKKGYKVVYFMTTFNYSQKPGFTINEIESNILQVKLNFNKKINIYKNKLSDTGKRFFTKKHLRIRKKSWYF